MATMAVIIVFTVFCERVLAKTKAWITYFNPILQPCLDKVVSELMILGATAFSLTIINELYTISGLPWYATLHWIDTVIFIFALLYVLCTVYVLGLMGRLTHRLAQIDAIPLKDLLVDASEDHTVFRRNSSDRLARASQLSHAVSNHIASSMMTAPEGSYYQQTEEKVHAFLTSENMELTLELEHAGCHKHIKDCVQLLQKNGMLNHTTKSMAGSTRTVILTKQPRSGWNLDAMTQAVQNAKKEDHQQSKWHYSFKIRFHLVKHYFLTTFFPSSSLTSDLHAQIDFVTYYEIVMSFGITECFNIGFREWSYLFLVTVPIVRDVDFGGGHVLKNYHIFTMACAVLLATSVGVTWWLIKIGFKIFRQHYKLDNTLASLQQALTDVHAKFRTNRDSVWDDANGADSSSGKPTKRTSKKWLSERASNTMNFFQNLMKNSHDLIEHSHGLSLAAVKRFKLLRPEKTHESLYGITLTENKLRKFFQFQLLVESFYLSIWICTFLAMYIDEKIPFMWMLAPLVIVLLNLLFVTPCAMFVGFG
jgi:hypothetical protein